MFPKYEDTRLCLKYMTRNLRGRKEKDFDNNTIVDAYHFYLSDVPIDLLRTKASELTKKGGWFPDPDEFGKALGVIAKDPEDDLKLDAIGIEIAIRKALSIPDGYDQLDLKSKTVADLYGNWFDLKSNPSLLKNLNEYSVLQKLKWLKREEGKLPQIEPEKIEYLPTPEASTMSALEKAQLCLDKPVKKISDRDLRTYLKNEIMGLKNSD